MELENKNVEAGVVIDSSGHHQPSAGGFYNKTTEIPRKKSNLIHLELRNGWRSETGNKLNWFYNSKGGK